MVKKGQSTLEYAVVIVVVLAALLAIQVYVRRSIQGKLRSSTDSIGEQYSAGNTTSKYTTSQTGNMATQEKFGLTKGVSRSEVTAAASVTRSATGSDAEKIGQLDSETLFKAGQ